MTRPLTLAPCLLLLLSLLGCGGSGGGAVAPAPVDDTLFSGAYHAFFLKGFDNSGATVLTSGFGTLEADGEGLITTTLTENENGIVSGPAPLTLLTYEVHADRTINWFFPAVSTAESWRGGISADGGLVVLSSVREGSDPEIVIAYRIGTGLGTSSFDGSYFTTTFAGYPGSPTMSAVGEAILDTDHPMRPIQDIWVVRNLDGSIDPREATRWGDWSTGSDGSATFDLFLGARSHGALSADGALLVRGGDLNEQLAPELTISVRREPPSPSSVPTFDGEYFLVGFQHLPESSEYRSTFGVLSADPVGGGTLLFAENVNRRAGSGWIDDVSYRLLPDGGLRMHLDLPCGGEAQCLLGGVAANGAFALLGGGAVDGTAPSIYFLIKRQAR